MNRLEWKEAMRKIKSANKRKGEKWGKKEIITASKMVQALKLEVRTNGQAEAIAEVLKNLKGVK